MNDLLTLLLEYLRGEAARLHLILFALWMSFAAIFFSLGGIVWAECRWWRARSESRVTKFDDTDLNRQDGEAEQDSGKGTKKLRATLTKYISQLVDQAKTSFTTRIDGMQKKLDTALDETRKSVDELVTDVREIKKRLEEDDLSLDEERAWFQRIEPIVHPLTARDLMFAAGGFAITSPERWAPSLEKRWTLLRQNPVFRDALVAEWMTDAVQNIGEHYNRLLRLSWKQYCEVRLATGGVPPRLAYWHRLYRTAKRHFLGVNNFFTRISHMNEPGFQTFASSIRGMTFAEQEIGWAHVTNPPLGETVVLAGTQFEDYLGNARRELLQSWVSHAYRLHQEIFEVARYERRDGSTVLDELDEVRFDGPGIVEEDVRAAGRLLGYDLIDIPLYGEVSAEVIPYINVRAAQHRNISDWMGYPMHIGQPIVLRLQTLAWKRRQGSDVLNGGAEIIVGKDDDA